MHILMLALDYCMSGGKRISSNASLRARGFEVAWDVIQSLATGGFGRLRAQEFYYASLEADITQYYHSIRISVGRNGILRALMVNLEPDRAICFDSCAMTTYE